MGKIRYVMAAEMIATPGKLYNMYTYRVQSLINEVSGCMRLSGFLGCRQFDFDKITRRKVGTDTST
ncbi:MAG: hypothetical protein AAGA73_24695, partial [Pseudomonadota bacterium]